MQESLARCVDCGHLTTKGALSGGMCHRCQAFYNSMDPTEEFVLSEEQAAAIDGAYHDALIDLGGES